MPCRTCPGLALQHEEKIEYGVPIIGAGNMPWVTSGANQLMPVFSTLILSLFLTIIFVPIFKIIALKINVVDLPQARNAVLPTLEERKAETTGMHRSRLRVTVDEFAMSDKMADYIEGLEVYLLELEQHVVDLENDQIDHQPVFAHQTASVSR